jgi:hypothetical protein
MRCINLHSSPNVVLLTQLRIVHVMWHETFIGKNLIKFSFENTGELHEILA